MLQSILVGLDGSPYAAAAIELGIRWAKQADAMLVGLGIIDEPTIRGGEAVPLGAGVFKERRDEARLAEARTTVEQFLGRFTVRCAEAGVACKVLEDVGLPAEQICLEAQRYDLILLGKQTHYHFETQGKPDETLTQVLKQSPRPVVTVPEQLPESGSVVIAYDGSLQAARALQAYLALRLGLSPDVHIVSVHANHEEAARRADRAVDFLGFHQIKAQRHAVVSSSPAEAILDQAKQLGAGLLVMGAYGQPALREFFFGSMTRSMLAARTVPLFLYH